ncbi:DUF4129 domain-containing protein [Actinophytocola sp.]|uniref:DUF4129 domain-containing protein n=1 Tax=Actinophytocola sp. TaxID=1872138 RepID=UPI0025C55361|nr:DUF4129 domain-containing protein [Actinophytocola sp.]
MRSSRVAVLCTVAALLLFAVVAARGKSAVPGSLRDVPLERGVGDTPPLHGAPTDENAFKVDVVDRAEVVQTFMTVIAMILLLIAFSLLVRHLRRLQRRKRRLGVGVEADEEIGALEVTMPMRLRRAAESARTELAGRRGGPPGDAVIAAWLRLEEATAHEGAGREPHQTATEFTAALLARHITREPALDDLRELYQRARFGPPGQVGDAEADAALAALDRILAALANGAAHAESEEAASAAEPVG